MNALLLPLALGLLVLLARRALPPEHRIDGVYRWAVYGVAGLTIGAALIGGITELVN